MSFRCCQSATKGLDDEAWPCVEGDLTYTSGEVKTRMTRSLFISLETLTSQSGGDVIWTLCQYARYQLTLGPVRIEQAWATEMNLPRVRTTIQRLESSILKSHVPLSNPYALTLRHSEREHACSECHRHGLAHRDAHLPGAFPTPGLPFPTEFAPVTRSLEIYLQTAAQPPAETLCRQEGIASWRDHERERMATKVATFPGGPRPGVRQLPDCHGTRPQR